MFTGIIEGLGIVKGVEKETISVESKEIFKNIKIGESISINGVCLTVVKHNKGVCSFDVMPETLKRTAISQVKRGNFVNIERSIEANGRFSGHFVLGHSDGVGKILKKKKKENMNTFEIEIEKELMRFIVPRGSIAIDGISLTIVDTFDKSFTVSIIPHTMSNTTLGFKSVSSSVNIEVDVLARYMDRMLTHVSGHPKRTMQGFTFKEKGEITEEFLKKRGF